MNAFFYYITEDFKNIPKDAGAIKKFGMLMASVMILVGGVIFLKTHNCICWLFVLGAFFSAAALFCPKCLRILYYTWMSLAVVMGFFMTRLILVVLYFLIITPISIAGRILKTDFLDLDIDGEAGTYWIDKKVDSVDADRLDRQF